MKYFINQYKKGFMMGVVNFQIDNNEVLGDSNDINNTIFDTNTIKAFNEKYNLTIPEEKMFWKKLKKYLDKYWYKIMINPENGVINLEKKPAPKLPDYPPAAQVVEEAKAKQKPLKQEVGAKNQKTWWTIETSSQEWQETNIEKEKVSEGNIQALPVLSEKIKEIIIAKEGMSEFKKSLVKLDKADISKLTNEEKIIFEDVKKKLNKIYNIIEKNKSDFSNWTKDVWKLDDKWRKVFEQLNNIINSFSVDNKAKKFSKIEKKLGLKLNLNLDDILNVRENRDKISLENSKMFQEIARKYNIDIENINTSIEKLSDEKFIKILREMLDNIPSSNPQKWVFMALLENLLNRKWISFLNFSEENWVEKIKLSLKYWWKDNILLNKIQFIFDNAKKLKIWDYQTGLLYKSESLNEFIEWDYWDLTLDNYIKFLEAKYWLDWKNNNINKEIGQNYWVDLSKVKFRSLNWTLKSNILRDLVKDNDKSAFWDRVFLVAYNSSLYLNKKLDIDNNSIELYKTLKQEDKEILDKINNLPDSVAAQFWQRAEKFTEDVAQSISAWKWTLPDLTREHRNASSIWWLLGFIAWWKSQDGFLNKIVAAFIWFFWWKIWWAAMAEAIQNGNVGDVKKITSLFSKEHSSKHQKLTPSPDLEAKRKKIPLDNFIDSNFDKTSLLREDIDIAKLKKVNEELYWNDFVSNLTIEQLKALKNKNWEWLSSLFSEKKWFEKDFYKNNEKEIKLILEKAIETSDKNRLWDNLTLAEVLNNDKWKKSSSISSVDGEWNNNGEHTLENREGGLFHYETKKEKRAWLTGPEIKWENILTNEYKEVILERFQNKKYQALMIFSSIWIDAAKKEASSQVTLWWMLDWDKKAILKSIDDITVFLSKLKQYLASPKKDINIDKLLDESINEIYERMSLVEENNEDIIDNLDDIRDVLISINNNNFDEKIAKILELSAWTLLDDWDTAKSKEITRVLITQKYFPELAEKIKNINDIEWLKKSEIAEQFEISEDQAEDLIEDVKDLYQDIRVDLNEDRQKIKDQFEKQNPDFNWNIQIEINKIIDHSALEQSKILFFEKIMDYKISSLKNKNDPLIKVYNELDSNWHKTKDFLRENSLSIAISFIPMWAWFAVVWWLSKWASWVLKWEKLASFGLKWEKLVDYWLKTRLAWNAIKWVGFYEWMNTTNNLIYADDFSTDYLFRWAWDTKEIIRNALLFNVMWIVGKYIKPWDKFISLKNAKSILTEVWAFSWVDLSVDWISEWKITKDMFINSIINWLLFTTWERAVWNIWKKVSWQRFEAHKASDVLEWFERKLPITRKLSRYLSSDNKKTNYYKDDFGFVYEKNGGKFIKYVTRAEKIGLKKLEPTDEVITLDKEMLKKQKDFLENNKWDIKGLTTEKKSLKKDIKKLEEAEEKIVDKKENIKKIKDKLTDKRKEVRDIIKKLRKYEENIDKIDKQIQDIEQEIIDLKQKSWIKNIEKVEESFLSFKGLYKRVNNFINKWKNKINELKNPKNTNDIKKLETIKNQIEGDLNIVKTLEKDLKDNMNLIRDELDNIKTTNKVDLAKWKRINKWLTNLENTLKTKNTELTKVKSEIDKANKIEEALSWVKVEEKFSKLYKKLDNKTIDIGWDKYNFSYNKDKKVLEIKDESWNLLKWEELSNFYKTFDEKVLKEFYAKFNESFTKKLKQLLKQKDEITLDEILTEAEKKKLREIMWDRWNKIEWNSISNFLIAKPLKNIWKDLKNISVDILNSKFWIKDLTWEWFLKWTGKFLFWTKKSLWKWKKWWSEKFLPSLSNPIKNTVSLWILAYIWERSYDKFAHWEDFIPRNADWSPDYSKIWLGVVWDIATVSMVWLVRAIAYLSLLEKYNINITDWFDDLYSRLVSN